MRMRQRTADSRQQGRVRRLLVLSAICYLLSTPAWAANTNCSGAVTNIEQFRYSWRLRGGLSWIAGIMFPTTGVAAMKNVYPKSGETNINSELLITAADQKSGFFVYESEMEASGQKTLMTYHGYAWGKKSRKERTLFDYVKRLARIHRETPDKVEDKVKPLSADSLRDNSLRDILTAIYYLRQNADKIHGPIQTSIYSDGKDYPVIFRPAESQTCVIDGRRVNTLGFEIADAPGGRKWQGGVKVWLTQDERRIPCRIEIRQSFAMLQLDLSSIEACAFMSASK
jgi:Protein of unknown function (DUF3108)